MSLYEEDAMGCEENHFVLQGRRLLSDIQLLLLKERDSDSFYKDLMIISGDGVPFSTSAFLLGSVSKSIKHALLQGGELIYLPDVSSSELRIFLNKFLEPQHSKADSKVIFSVGCLLGIDFPSSEPSVFPCPHCSKKFTLNKLLSRHLRVVHSTNPEYQCLICLHRCRSKSELTIHVRIHTKEKPYPCHICSKFFFAQTSQLNDHLINVHNESITPTKKGCSNVCEICGLKLGSRVAVRRHIKIHQKPDVKEMSDIEDEEEDEDEDDEEELLGDEEKKSFECIFCKKRFSQKSHLSVHEQGTHQGLRHNMCPYCGKTFSAASNMKKHLLIHYQQSDSNEDGKSSTEQQFKHVCEYCGRLYDNLHYLRIHVKTHSTEAPLFPCEECHEKFSSISALKIHQKFHKGETQFTCTVLPTRNFKCVECGKAFIQKAHLKTHLLQHSGERPFVCVTCGKSFFTHSNLKEHSKIHTGEKKKYYECSACPATYVNASDLKIHTLKHSGESPFSCDFCKKNRFQCKNCNKSFTSPSGLRQHFSHHDTCHQTASEGAYTIKKVVESGESHSTQVNHPIIYASQGEQNVLMDFSQDTLSEQTHLFSDVVNHDPMLVSGPDEEEETLSLSLPVISKIV
ncbi:KRAB [Lepeophtheirus salmonis]|uniref:KRAB n=1 Tax=Lepeophtheirus salmonis TaxID=72036 RepID=A0A7R8CPK9_LEPSM|nr:KRAB [Lepeophtheirus salmonis]CAF2887374.1 KRAB [Lepeophtheirus salmonis]